MLFQPGQSGNPLGRPKGTQTFAGLLRRKTQLAHLFMEEAEEKLPIIVKSLFELAEKGDLRAISLVLDHALVKTPTADLPEEHTDYEPMSKEELRISIEQTMKECRALSYSILRQAEKQGVVLCLDDLSLLNENC